MVCSSGSLYQRGISSSVERNNLRKSENIPFTNPTNSCTLKIGPPPFPVRELGRPADQAVQIGDADPLVVAEQIKHLIDDGLRLDARGEKDIVDRFRVDGRVGPTVLHT